MKRIAILTSSRADYGIYLPLLQELKIESTFDLKIIVFGTHLSPFHGYTINQIIGDGFDVSYQIDTMLVGDSPNAIASAIALTLLKFSEFWKNHQSDFDLVFCLGDRYEMFGAVTAGIPFIIPMAHLHGGESTLGAIDNIFRHSITLASKYHFVSCEEHAKRIEELTGHGNNIFNIGALSLDKLTSINLLSIEEFYHKFMIDLNIPTILVTVHPETIESENNFANAEILGETLLELDNFQVLITMPNADTYGYTIRKRLQKLPEESNHRIHCVENLGFQGYFSAMKYCSFLLGNSSSGIIEAASLGKYCINLGNRQKGRKQNQNCINVPFNRQLIMQSVEKIAQDPDYKGSNIYYKENVAKNICAILKNIL